MKVFMFISGRSYGNSLKYKAFYVCMSFMLMALFSTIFTAKPAFATDNPTSIDHGSVKCPDGYVPRQDGDSDWWGCSQQGIFGGQGAFVGGVDLVITCTAGWKAVFTTKTGTTTVGVRVPTPINYKLGHCVEEPKSVVEKNAEALADKAGQDSLVTLISPKIEDSPWYLGLSDADKVTAGCKWQKADVDVPGSPGKILTCNNDARQKLAKMLIGTCIADAVKTIAARTNGDTGSSAMDAVFTSCLAGHSGVDEASIKAQKGEIAWNDIKEDVDISGSAATEESKADEAKNSCGIDGIGWFICPLMNFASNISDSAYSAISQFLSIDPKIFKNDSTSGGLKQAWNFFRDIANAVFAVIFLWVIFSQISNVGVSNYGIKKILPRLIIGALLVNLSFYLCQLAVDLSNILGFSLKGVLERAASEIDTQSAAAGSFYTVVVGALALTGAVLFLFLAVSIPTIMALLLALLVVLVILIVRQAAVILLIAISPLAFAAWLLPNTENLFKKWVSMFKGLLVVFPVVSLLYGAGKLAGAILAASATDDPNNPKETMQFAALAASILPLGATPFVLKSSLNSLGSFAGKLGGLSGLANKKLGSTIANKSRINDVKNAWKSRSARKLAERRSGNTWWGRNASNLRGSSSWLKKGLGVAMNPAAALDNNWVGKKIGLGDGVGAAQEAYDKSAMEKAERSITYKYGGDAEAALKDKKADKYTRIAAVNQLKGQGAHGADVVANYLIDGGKVDSISMANALTEMKGSHAGIAQAGVSALKDLQKGKSSFSLEAKDKSSGKVIPGSADAEFSKLTSEGVSKLSNEAIAKQNADAINRSSLSNSQASEILGDDRLVSIMSPDTKSALLSK